MLTASKVLRMGGRVVYGSGLENRRARKGTVSSNLTPSANFMSTPPFTRNHTLSLECTEFYSPTRFISLFWIAFEHVRTKSNEIVRIS